MTRPPVLDDAALMRLIARTDTADALLAGDARFVAWLAARERLRAERPGSRASRFARETASQREEASARRGAELLARAHARRLSVRQASAPLEVERARDVATAAQVVDVAAREHRSPLVTLGVAAGVGRELWDEPVDEWVVLPDDIGDGRHLALRIVGESMAPLMHTGDTVLVKLEQEPRVNAVIVARHEDDGYVCKRVSRLLPNRIELASLEAGRPLIVIPRDPSLILGTVLMVWNTSRGRARTAMTIAR